MRRPAVLVALLGVVALVVRRRSAAGRSEKDVWTQATAAPDLR